MVRFTISGKYIVSLILVCTIFLLNCATFYEQNIRFQQQFVQGNFESADAVLNKNKKAAKDKNRLLYFLQKGVVLQLLGRYEESNQFFEEAYLFTEDLQKNFALDAVSLFTNPNVKPYRGEDFEVVMIHYYKALNYLFLGKSEESLIECRRMNIKLNEFNDRYSKRKNRYKRDAFILNLMGIVYEVNGEVNNAYISYRNAVEAYEEDYSPHFGIKPPKQLIRDLMRTAYLNGFKDDLAGYEQKYGLRYEHQVRNKGDLIFFWHNGLGPVKDEWSLNFFIVKGKGGLVTFVNEDMGLTFPFMMDGGSGGGGLGDLKFVRVAFPKYRERESYYRSAEITVNTARYPLEISENINAIAFTVLEDRMVRELANSLLRLAIKQAAEQAVRNKNQNIGALLSVANALSEKTDARNWQTLPYHISYARIPLPTGENRLELICHSPRKTRQYSHPFSIHMADKETQFYLFHNLESLPLE